MKAFKSVLSLIILGLIMPAVWAAEEAIIEDLQTDVTVTKSKADKNTQNIKRLMGGLPALEARVAALEAELERVSPDPDLTGKTYCLFMQFGELFADGVSAEIEFGGVGSRMDFTSPTQVTHTEIYDLESKIHLPANTITNTDDLDGPGFGTYTVVGSQLAVTFDEDGQPQTGFGTLTPDGQVVVFGRFDQSVDGSESGMIFGVQATSCN
jgi:hypothetical protein